MSVQAGIWHFDGKPVDRTVLAKISSALAVYGPDGESITVDGPTGMLYRPFHTTAESRLEHQPYVNGRKIITWDGRLDNRKELIRDLCDDLGDEKTDVSLVAVAFDQWGTKCFAKLVGDWALAIWDPEEKTLILARDYVGVRRLFYYVTGKQVTWSTDLTPLASCGDRFSLSDEYIAGYFGHFPDAHLTPYREIQCVPPGGFVVIHNGVVRTQLYWSFNRRHTTRYSADAEYEEHFRELFRQAVRRRLRTDSPILADLSGGYDSSSIVCMADDLLAKEGAGTQSLDTFSFFDVEEPEEEDFLYFSKVEQQRGRIGYHAKLHGSGDTFSFDYKSFMPAPGFGPRQELKAARAEAIRKGNYRVVLSGLWGDEFTGYALDPRVQLADLLIQLRLAAFWNQLKEWSTLGQRPWVQVLAQTVLFLLPASLRARIKRLHDLEPWLDQDFARKHGIIERLLTAGEGSWTWSVTSRFWHQTYLRATRRLASLHPSCVEHRYPYLDQHLTEFLSSVPSDQLVRPGNRRSLARRALAPLLPPEILSRRTKSGTGRCMSVTLDKHWDKLDPIVRSSITARLGYIDSKSFYDALVALRNGTKPPLNVVLLLNGLSLELWLRDMRARGIISLPKADLSHNQTLPLERSMRLSLLD